MKRDGGFIVNMNNPIAEKRDTSKDKDRKITNVKWNKTSAKVGEELTLEASVSNQYEGAAVYFKIFKEGADIDKDSPVSEVLGRLKGGKAEAKWRYIYVHNPDEPLTKKPKFFFQAWCINCGKKKSDSVEISDDFEIILKNPDGSLAKNVEYKAILPGGETKEGKTDATGKIKIKDIIPGDVEVEIKGSEDYHYEGSES